MKSVSVHYKSFLSSSITFHENYRIPSERKKKKDATQKTFPKHIIQKGENSCISSTFRDRATATRAWS